DRPGRPQSAPSRWYHGMVARGGPRVMDHALTVRLPDQIYRAARNMADRRGISLNRLVQEALAEKAKTSVEKRLSRAYDVLAGDPAEADIENSFAIQAEALLGE